MTPLVLSGPIARADIGGLCEHALTRFKSVEGDVVICDVGALGTDAAGVDALARLHLGAKSCGVRLQLVDAPDALRDLIAFMGLEEALLADQPSN